MNRNVREAEEKDIPAIVDYFITSTPEYLQGRGVEINKLPSKDDWCNILLKELEKPKSLKKLYYLIWQIDNEPVGHSHINDIVFGQEAYMHLHLWEATNRQKGMGTFFVKESLPYYFGNFKLRHLFCQPYALNPAPNKTLEKVGFKFIKKYKTIPGWINFEQYVNLWMFSESDLQIIVNNENLQ